MEIESRDGCSARKERSMGNEMYHWDMIRDRWGHCCEGLLWIMGVGGWVLVVWEDRDECSESF